MDTLLPAGPTPPMKPEDIEDLRTAKRLLENITLAARIADALGKPIEKGMELLPEKWSQTVDDATARAVRAALNAALLTLNPAARPGPKDVWHKATVTLTGFGGGIGGLATLAIELPVSTIIMLRSIADIARNQGEDLHSPEAKLACLTVFALVGPPSQGGADGHHYFAVRGALAQAVRRAATFVAERGFADESAPIILRLISKIAGRYSIAIGEKVAAQAIPLVGAAGGALINYVFIAHFQDMAKGHFTVRRLERTYGAEVVRAEYDRLSAR